jgi:hypothetical protein
VSYIAASPAYVGCVSGRAQSPGDRSISRCCPPKAQDAAGMSTLTSSLNCILESTSTKAFLQIVGRANWRGMTGEVPPMSASHKTCGRHVHEQAKPAALFPSCPLRDEMDSQRLGGVLAGGTGGAIAIPSGQAPILAPRELAQPARCLPRTTQHGKGALPEERPPASSACQRKTRKAEHA